ncbi:hypothetical protein GXW78_04565 [Roseomonas terrae]|jgi:hypothetical protein|uniref:Uncharacterized protein n=1 Tax=Neoroseomonas terrae TaxID=424799 RepID=A0ABS5ED29_9PROT|nr:hypothetical protein [Neoroseomonas terrae]MBR0648923.1 hypothetical protein [Neoroseomonas terrae]
MRTPPAPLSVSRAPAAPSTMAEVQALMNDPDIGGAMDGDEIPRLDLGCPVSFAGSRPGAAQRPGPSAAHRACSRRPASGIRNPAAVPASFRRNRAQNAAVSWKADR